VFYPEGGGQVGDVGGADFGDAHLDVVDTYRVEDRIAHLVSWKSDVPAEDAFEQAREGRLSVDAPTRLATARNHTATHLLHAALREVLGDHVAQAGSLVAPGRLRFDFHHYQAMKPDEVARVERIVNQAVMADMRVTAGEMPYDEAVASGAMALFGEKYGDTVRVVSIEDFSKELCGGTHLAHTGEIGPFAVRQESAVGSGLRRIEALTGDGTLDYVQKMQDERHALATMLKVSPDDLERRIRQLVDDSEEMQRELRKARASQAKDQAGDVLSSAVDVGGVQFVAGAVDAADVPALREYGDALRGKLDLGVGVLCQNRSEKPVCLLIASDRVIKEKSVTAGDLAKRVSAELGFRGGGKPHMAQIGLPNMSEFSRLRDFVKASLESMI
jgi:alanyl-tRNA synthetase